MKRAALTLLMIGVAAVGAAATILEHQVDLVLDGDGFNERERLLVAIEESGDLDAWGSYAVLVDDDIELREVAIEILGADGEVVDRVPRRKLRKVTSVGFGLHTSAAAEVADLPMLAVGQRVRIDVTRRHTPIFPTTRVPLQESSPQSRLRVTVRGGGAGLRWSLRAADDLVTVEESDGGLEVVGEDVAARIPPAHAGDAWAVAPALVLAWGENAAWSDVGSWYHELTAAVPTGSEAVTALAKQLSADAGDDRQARAAAVIDHVKRRIRYEAVEIGVGGWVPTAPADVIDRGWGDCKDKSLLVRDLLAALDIEARLVLIHNGRSGRVEASFPSTLGFNHCIVAVAAEDLGDTPAAPVVDGWVFVDPTQDRGSALWLSPWIQGQWALVAGTDDARLVQIPEVLEEQGRILEVAGELAMDGTVSGMAGLRLVGGNALSWIRALESEDPERLEEQVRMSFQRVLPGADLGVVGWREIPGGEPAFQLDAEVTVSGFARGVRLRPPYLWTLPETRELEDRTEPVVLSPGVHRTRWILELPESFCRPRAVNQSLENPVGNVRLSAAPIENGRFVIERTVEVHRSWVDPELLSDLVALSTAESRGNKRSLKIECED